MKIITIIAMVFLAMPIYAHNNDSIKVEDIHIVNDSVSRDYSDELESWLELEPHLKYIIKAKLDEKIMEGFVKECIRYIKLKELYEQFEKSSKK